MAVYLSTAYLAPVQYYSKLFHNAGSITYKEAQENYVKQTYRNRCIIAAANGALPLSIPIEKSETLKTLTQDIRISQHDNWQRLHWNALVSAYNMSPFFEYYADSFAPFYHEKQTFLMDFNEAMEHMICELLDMPKLDIRKTEEFNIEVPNDFRYAIRPKHAPHDACFEAKKYYQVFDAKHGFLPNLSIADLLFNMGPEALLVLRDSRPASAFG